MRCLSPLEAKSTRTYSYSVHAVSAAGECCIQEISPGGNNQLAAISYRSNFPNKCHQTLTIKSVDKSANRL